VDLVNRNLETEEILTLPLAEVDSERILRVSTADDCWPRDRGQTSAIPQVSDLGLREGIGFAARCDFGFRELSAGAEGQLIIASFATGRDGSGRSSGFKTESFFRERDGLSS
jgi:hypothetical protein